LRTPLTHIRGYLDLLNSNDLGPITPEQFAAVQVMLRSSERLERLIEDLILFSTASRGEVTIHWAKFNLADVCQAVYLRALPKAEEKKVRLELVNAPKDTIIEADEEKILWTLMQLLDNAIKFTPAEKIVELRLSAEDQLVRISVSDEGIGIPEDRIEEIFEPFHQLDGSSTRRYGGTGLGLALVRQIIEAHGSTIQVTSGVGQGSVFEFVLMRAQSAGVS
jgi:signal transduction histidine kinase